MASILNVKNLRINFGGILALEDLTFSVNEGCILGIIGPNGAGKTTLFNCISRIYKPDKGYIFFFNKDLLKLHPHEIAKIGIARTFQNIELFDNMTVLENLLIGKHCIIKTGIFSEALFLGKTKKKEKLIIEEIEDLMRFFNFNHLMDENVSNLPYGFQKYVELARAISLKPKLLLLDEPTSGLNVSESNELGHFILNMKEKFNMTILIVEHNVHFVTNLSERIIVLHNGKKIAEGIPEEILKNPSVIEAYLGKEENVTKSK